MVTIADDDGPTSIVVRQLTPPYTVNHVLISMKIVSSTTGIESGTLVVSEEDGERIIDLMGGDVRNRNIAVSVNADNTVRVTVLQ